MIKQISIVAGDGGMPGAEAPTFQALRLVPEGLDPTWSEEVNL